MGVRAHRGVLDGAAGEEGHPRPGPDRGPCFCPQPYPRLRPRAHGGGGGGAPGPARPTRLHGNLLRAQCACAELFAPLSASLCACALSAAGRAVAVATGRALRGRTAPPPTPVRGARPRSVESKTWKVLILFYLGFSPHSPSEPPHVSLVAPHNPLTLKHLGLPKRGVASGLLLSGEFSLRFAVWRVRSSSERTNPYLE